MSALAVAIVRTLQDLIPEEEPLSILQSNVAVEIARLRRTSDAEMAIAISRFVRDSLRNPDVLGQPSD